jgi:hypothetical protein
LRRHPEDRVLKPLLEGVFAALEQADILGSLLRPAEHIDAAITALQAPHTVPMDFEADDAALRRTITELARRDPAELKQVLLDRVAKSFAAEAGAGDVAADLFGREAERGVRLLQLLDQRYAVVVTNPPYMGSGNMGTPLKRYVEENFPLGKTDLYTAFMLRNLDLCVMNGHVSMITLHGWLFMNNYSDFRALSEDNTTKQPERAGFTGILRESTIESLGHLGRYAFSELGNAVIAPVMFAIRNKRPSLQHKIWAARLTAPRVSEEQSLLLSQLVQRQDFTPLSEESAAVFTAQQTAFLAIPDSPISYWISGDILRIFQSPNKLIAHADVKKGIDTGDNTRLLRNYWETTQNARWKEYAKGGGFCRWYGLRHLSVDWFTDGRKLLSGPSATPRNLQYLGISGLTYTVAASGSLGVRQLLAGTIFDSKSASIFSDSLHDVASLLNSRISSFLLRCMTPGIDFNPGYVAKLPYPNKPIGGARTLSSWCLAMKHVIASSELLDKDFSPDKPPVIDHPSQKYRGGLDSGTAILNSVEAIIDRNSLIAFSLSSSSIRAILAETGAPAGFHPLIAGYEALPELPADLGLPALPQEVIDYLAAHERIAPSPAELRRIKERLRALYEAGPGAKEEDAGEAEASGGEDEEGAASGAHIPIPTETFLEELAVKMQLHPISVYWLLEELRREGARCKPEERRLLEDRLSVLVLRLLGHRWPRQIEAGEPVPHWADRDGIIALASGPYGLAERVRARLREEDGDVGANRADGLLVELTGLSLEEWLRREFFKRHVRQFKYRPIAWHLASDPAAAAGGGKGRGRGGRRQPAFECLLYYHATAGDALARVRTQYVEPLLRVERQSLDAARRTHDETTAAQAQARIQELEEFTRRLREVEEQGFACPELDKTLAGEPLDRWSGDGVLAPAERDDLIRQERAWRVDLNDGVRVNIAPLQLAGLLVSDVLKAADARKAISDRVRWRSDERRWVREGKLPRCGWMPDTVLESQAWTRLAPQREAERRKLEEKRRAALGGQTATG